MTGDRPRLSVVVASSDARDSIRECLGSLASGCDGGDVDLLVVDNSTDGTPDIIRREFPGIRVVRAPRSALIPELWSRGLLESRGDLAAITTAHCVPARDWVARVLEAHGGPEAGVGGAIENDPSAGLVDWAIYFCRYSSFMLPLPRAIVPDIAGDNACYKRVHLDACRDAWSAGFWEPAVHARLQRAGLRLVLEPAIVVHHRRSFGVTGFVGQRFRHGLEYGRERTSRLGPGRRLLHVVLGPAIPVVLWLRIVRRVTSRRRHRGKLVLATPLVALFLVAWTTGELLGYLRGRRR